MIRFAKNEFVLHACCALAIGAALGSLPGCRKPSKGGKVEHALIEDHRKIDFKTDVHVEVPEWHRPRAKCSCCNGKRCICQKGNCRCNCPVKVQVKTPRVKVDVR